MMGPSNLLLLTLATTFSTTSPMNPPLAPSKRLDPRVCSVSLNGSCLILGDIWPRFLSNCYLTGSTRHVYC